ncbi:MAG: hypothetical protein A2150_07630, partial [Candidatus Muproteobacteria bacterium RBG_16_64_11]
FTAAGVERAAFLAQIKFTVNRRSDGRYTIHLSTPAAIEEPFLHLLLQLDWPGGRLVREYTALIDPPYQIAAKAPTVEPPRAAAPAPKAEPLAPAPKPEAVVAPPAPVQPPVIEAARIVPAEDLPYGPPAIGEVGLSSDGWPLEPGETPPAKSFAPRTAAKGRIGPAPSWANVANHTVKPGETLWSIASKVRKDTQVNVEQAALAIFRNNKDAFFGNNLNNIHAGRILRLPEREAIEAIPRETARAEFQTQFDAWQEHKLKLAGAKRTLKADAPAAEQPEKPASVAETKPKAAAPATRKETPAAAKGQRSDELLKIVRANLQGEKGADGRKTAEPAKAGAAKEHETLAERAATLEESLVSKQIEQKELGEKINQVRTQLKRESRLIELESQSLAPPAAKPVEPPKVEAPKIEPPKAEAPKAEAAKAEAPKVEAPKPEDKPKAEAPKPAPKKVLPPPPSPETGFFDTLIGSLGDLFLPIVLGVVVLVSAVLGFVYLRRRRQAVAEFEESILASQAVNTENVPNRDTTGEAAATTPESSILSDISQGNLANIHTDEVDPIAEAEVYLAYGRDETAEEILKDAVVKHPQRQELKLKLLEIYFHRKDLKAFETMAEEVYAAVGGKGGKHWEKVEEMGRKLNPENPMFRGAPAGRVTTSAEEKQPAAAAPAVTTPPTEVVSPPAPEVDLDFDIGTPVAAAPRTGNTFDLDFDLGEIKPASPGVAPGRAGHGAEEAKAGTGPAGGSGMGTGLEALDFGAPDDNLIDFDLGKTDTGPSQPVAPTGYAAKETKTAASTSEDFSWDLGTPAPAEPAVTELAPETAAVPATGEAQQHQWDEAATKLDLARAYIDMGDADGARSILEEVTAEGNPEQKKQAQELSTQLR